VTRSDREPGEGNKAPVSGDLAASTGGDSAHTRVVRNQAPHHQSVAKATLWVCGLGPDDGPAPCLLDGKPMDLTTRPPRAIEGFPGAGAAPAAVLLPARQGNPSPWVLIVKPGASVHVNGLPVLAGIRVASHRDEIRVEHQAPLYFSTETPATVEAFPGGPRPVHCPRCKLAIGAGAPAVRCPNCGVWHHQLEDRPCYTYAGGCAACGAPTALDGGYQWVPEAP